MDLDSTKSTDVISMVDAQFANYGTPETVFSDNGPQFASTEFHDFTTKVGTQHVTSSPGYPSSNGQTERSIETAKETMAKMFADGRSLNDVLRSLRNAPIGGGLPSPAVLLQSRQLRTSLAINKQALEPQPLSTAEVREKLAKQQGIQSFYARTSAHTAKMRVRKGKTWVPTVLPGAPSRW